MSRSQVELQQVAASCSVLQCVAVCCSVWQLLSSDVSVSSRVAVSCNKLQCAAVAVCCRVLQRVAASWGVLQCVAVAFERCLGLKQSCSELQQVVMFCGVSRCVAECCSDLQRVRFIGILPIRILPTLCMHTAHSDYMMHIELSDSDQIRVGQIHRNLAYPNLTYSMHAQNSDSI